MWIDQSSSTYKAAAYLAIEVSPRLSELLGRPVLGWEHFLRQVEAGGSDSARALYRRPNPPSVRMSRAVRADWYVPLLFGITPPLLLILYVISGVRRGDHPVPITLACLVGTLVWVFAIVRFTDFVRNTKIIDQAILAAGSGTSGSAAGT